MMNKHLVFSCLFSIILFLIPKTASADIVYPARLEITEISPGVYEVYYVLPVVQGKVLKAEAILPELCQLITDRKIGGDAFIKWERWTIRCTESLHGKKIGIEGLQGSQISIILKISMINGRVYETSLSPVNAFYLVPEPPSFFNIAGPAIRDGLNILLSTGGLYFLLLILFMMKARSFNWLNLFLLSTAIAVGNFLATDQLLIIPGYMGLLIPLILAALCSIHYLHNRALPSVITHWFAIVSIGMIMGASMPVLGSSLGLTESEMMLTVLFRWVGIFAGLILAYLLIREGLHLFRYFLLDKERWLVYAVGIGSVGWLIYESSLFLIAPALLPKMILYSLILPILLGLMVNLSDRSAERTLLLFSSSSIAGLVWGLFVNLPIIVIPAIMGIVFILITLVLYKTTIRPLIWTLMVLLIGIGGGWATGYFTELNQSYAIGHGIAYWLYSTAVFILTVTLFTASGNVKQGSGISGILLTAAASGLFILFIRDSYSEDLRELIAMGKIPVPFVSILLIIAALYFWPRKRRIHEKMNMAQRTPLTSVILIAMALVCLPFLNLRMQNPISDSGLTDSGSARQILQGILSNTYESFNISDEDQLFEQLSASVDEELIDEVYLDSRRRLNAGVRLGAEVRIRNVEVLSIENIHQRSINSYEYDAEWVVIARVKHLQHIHFRRNKYLGTIQMHQVENQWKISNIELKSEDRSIVPASAS
ncbi:hypothetical protein [Fulvivirga sedimenti]|uniref:Uncharacterized protein n=1 Tax=Fulvivirga sedimenti TaxID=2879465 RepID=A0A9X1KYM0_9BACT|nr:hypothetical protein [Fulvivirga sedimenti]MCA6074967.1 hypothetical protein [Fulvivirga sedimenti]MCA6076144.1 hypothetical protein [Fulvivirga sedimenti]MCA6077272.1 hypothetical protein [Fulvivirga sedimenti]